MPRDLVTKQYTPVTIHYSLTRATGFDGAFQDILNDIADGLNDVPLALASGSMDSALVISSTAIHALSVGPNGDTNPAFVVACNAASQTTGWALVGAATGGGAGLSVVSPAADELGVINSKGAGDLYLNNSATGAVRIGNALLPKTDDSTAVGSATERFADVFLSTGAVTNYNNGNFTVTHAAGQLTFSGLIVAAQDRGLRLNNQTSGAAAQSGTLTNAPAAGNPGHWLKINIGGTNYCIPCWAG